MFSILVKCTGEYQPLHSCWHADLALLWSQDAGHGGLECGQILVASGESDLFPKNPCKPESHRWP